MTWSVRGAVVLVALSTVVALVAGFAWWWTHPTLFRDLGVAEGMDRPLPVAQARLSEGIVFPPLHGGTTVDLRSASAHFTTNSAAARASFVICHDGAVGLVKGDLGKYCTSTTALPSSFRFAHGDREIVVMTLTASKPGRVHVDKVTLDYRRGSDRLWQRGKQTIAVDLTFSAR